MSGLSGRAAVALVARREITERAREKSFLVSTGVTLAIVLIVSVLPNLLGFGGPASFTVAVTDRDSWPVAQLAAREATGFDTKLNVRLLNGADARSALAAGDVDVVLSGRGVAGREQPDDELVSILQAANRDFVRRRALRRAGISAADAAAALNPPPLRVSSTEPPDPERDRKGAFAFVAVLLLYAQLLTFGFLLASGVVEEKASRVVEVLLATIRPRDLLAGKVIGLGLLGLGQLLLITAAGLAMATATGALELSGDLVAAAALALGWFVLGYAFYAGLFACAGALVPRQEELQSSMMPLTILILASFFLAFAVLDDPDGTLAHVTSFLPMCAPMTMPPRIALGEASPLEIVGAFVVTAAAAAALIPLAGRIYSGAILRTGSSIRLRDAWRASRGASTP
jgi:ABC-2 type transport system permease protein